MKKTNLVALCIAVAFTIVGIFVYTTRENHKLVDILPSDDSRPSAEALISWDDESTTELSNEQAQMLFDSLETFEYEYLKKADSLDNYASIHCVVGKDTVELIFSERQGGLILVNDLNTDGSEKIYKILPDGKEIKNLLYEFKDSNK